MTSIAAAASSQSQLSLTRAAADSIVMNMPTYQEFCSSRGGGCEVKEAPTEHVPRSME